MRWKNCAEALRRWKEERKKGLFCLVRSNLWSFAHSFKAILGVFFFIMADLRGSVEVTMSCYLLMKLLTAHLLTAPFHTAEIWLNSTLLLYCHNQWLCTSCSLGECNCSAVSSKDWQLVGIFWLYLVVYTCFFPLNLSIVICFLLNLSIVIFFTGIKISLEWIIQILLLINWNWKGTNHTYFLLCQNNLVLTYCMTSSSTSFKELY